MTDGARQVDGERAMMDRSRNEGKMLCIYSDVERCKAKD